jgi:hypothetical protein
VRNLILFLALIMAGCATPGYYWPNLESSRSGYSHSPIPQGGYGESRIMKHDAYGPGVHMDQYGAPVKVAPY